MISDKHLHDEWECPECGEDGLTAKEFRNHGIEEHPEIEPMTNLYPQYHVCDSAEVDVYMLAVTEKGPYYMAWDERDYVDEMHPWELLRHDWEWVEREETPFPEFEE